MTVVIDGTSGITTPGMTNSGSDAITGNQTVSGRSTFATTIGVGNATPSTSGAGITFPATQSASSDVNTLDDYEEGTWTAVIDSATPGTGRVTTVNSATYVKIGRVCYVNMYLTLSTLGTGGSGGIVVNGFPFPSQGYSGLAMVYFDQFNSTLSSVGLTTDPNATTSQLRAVATATASTILPSFATYAKANLNFIVTGCYQTTA